MLFKITVSKEIFLIHSCCFQPTLKTVNIPSGLQAACRGRMVGRRWGSIRKPLDWAFYPLFDVWLAWQFFQCYCHQVLVCSGSCDSEDRYAPGEGDAGNTARLTLLQGCPQCPHTLPRLTEALCLKVQTARTQGWCESQRLEAPGFIFSLNICSKNKLIYTAGNNNLSKPQFSHF